MNGEEFASLNTHFDGMWLKLSTNEDKMQIEK